MRLNAPRNLQLLLLSPNFFVSFDFVWTLFSCFLFCCLSRLFSLGFFFVLSVYCFVCLFLLHARRCACVRVTFFLSLLVFVVLSLF